MKSTKMKLLCVVLCFALIASACGAGTPAGGGNVEEASVTLTLGLLTAAESVEFESLLLFQELVYERTNGTVTIELYPAAQLGNPTIQIEAVSFGAQDIFFGGGSWLASYISDAMPATMFFVFEDLEHFKRYVESDLMESILEQFRETMGIRVIGNNSFYPARSFASNRAIHTVDDFRGLSGRVPDIRTYLDSYIALGASPTQIALGETYLALVQGVVDMCCAPFDTLYTMNFHEAVDYIVITEHVFDNWIYMMNDNTFQSLSPNQQNALVQSAYDAGVFYNERINAQVAEIYASILAAGVTIIYPERQGMIDALAVKIAELEADGVWAAGLYDQIRALRN